MLTNVRDWEMHVDLHQRLTFPYEVAQANLHPDLVLWSSSSCHVLNVELTVPWEDSIVEAFERKRLQYAELAVEAEEWGWKVTVCLVEVSCRGQGTEQMMCYSCEYE